jgi:hypothetical protein
MIDATYLLENNYAVVACAGCVEKFFELTYEVKTINFCSECSKKAGA